MEKKTQNDLSELCRIYWRPIFTCILGRGHSLEDAQDLTQDFMIKITDPTFLQKADPAKGSFRGLVWRALQNFLIDTHRISLRKRRTVGQTIPIEDWLREAGTTAQLRHGSSTAWTSAQLFDCRWAATLSSRALDRLREECASKGRERAFLELHPYLGCKAGHGEYTSIANVLGLSEENIRTMLSRLRGRYRDLLREEVAATLHVASEVDEELSYLFSLLSQCEKAG